MSIWNISFDDVDERALAQLLATQAPESLRLEYKEVPSAKDANDQFLRAFASFANAEGGDLLYGVRCKDGIPIEMAGLDPASADDVVQRFESLARDRVEPRVHRYRVQPKRLGNGQVVVHVRVPRSLEGPHAIRDGDRRDFWARNSSGKHRMSAGEVRHVVQRSTDALTSADRWRRDRIDVVERGEGSVPLSGSAHAFLHIVTLGEAPKIDLNHPDVVTTLRRVLPFNQGASERFTFDGLVNVGSSAYICWFDDARVEAVLGDVARDHKDRLHLTSSWLVQSLGIGLGDALGGLRSVGLAPPYAVMLGVTGVKGAVIRSEDPIDRARGIDRDELVLPPELIDDIPGDAFSVLRPGLDRIWRAAGHVRCYLFDETGKYRGDRR